MSLLERVREEVEQGAARGSRATAVPNLRPIALKLIDLLGKELSRSGTSESSQVSWVNEVADRWLHGHRLAALTRGLVEEINALRPDVTDAARDVDLTAAVAFALKTDMDLSELPADLVPPDMPLAQRAILERLARRRLSTATFDAARRAGSSAAERPDRYAMELGLLMSDGATSAGKALLRFRGRDAVRWLVASELVTSAGAQDEWRCSPEVAAWLLQTGRRMWDATDEDDRPWFSPETISRWSELGLLAPSEHEDFFGFSVTQLGRDLLTELTASDPPPILGLVQALAADTTAEALRAVDGRGERAAIDTVEQATVRQARVLAHELRNKLVPLKTAIDILSAVASPPTDRAMRAVELAGTAIAELFRFVDTTVELAQGLQKPHDWYSLEAALRDGAKEGTNGHQNATPVYDDTLDRWEMRGPREQFVLAISNLVRNAAQAAVGQPIRIFLGRKSKRDRVIVAVDDTGPGVPAERRARVFESGYSTRPGGTGLGIEIVKHVVERDLHGTVHCVASPQGGARFEMNLPATVFRNARRKLEKEE